MKRQAFRHQKDQAIRYRYLGMSYGEINRLLGIPKSTLSNWLSRVEFSEEVKSHQVRHANLARAKHLRRYNELRHERYLIDVEAYIEQCAREVPPATDQNLFYLFVGLFWGEGSKNQQYCVTISNSDPRMIQAVLNYLRCYCKIPVSRIKGEVHLHARNDEHSALTYWQNVTGIPNAQLRCQLVVSRASRDIRPANRLPNGTFRIVVQSAEFTRRVNGWLKGVINLATLPR